MSTAIPPRIDFRENSRRIDPHIPIAIQRATARLVAVRAAAVSQIPDWETLRQTAHDIRLRTLDHLDEYITQVERQVVESGGHVHHARDAAEANAIVVAIARQHQVKTVVKGKSMASEEIGLNHALDQAGVRAVETDVGEFIIQLAGVPPSHILGPAMHMSKEEIAALFAQKLGVNAPPDPRRLTDIARAQLREIFLRAEMGVTGANFIVAETGTVVLVTNEGNGRMCTTLPDVHVVVAGIDKIGPDWNGVATLLPMLVRNAT
ncbi:MAG: lactate utilization protein, partial [Chloroflexota bacterium]|nr:lactate utilization protein [Chloroflexota bacterium]